MCDIIILLQPVFILLFLTDEATIIELTSPEESEPSEVGAIQLSNGASTGVSNDMDRVSCLTEKIVWLYEFVNN